jgi:ankyrin repeat protein
MGLDQQRHADRGDVVRLLARAGADLNAQDEKGNTALHETHYPEIAAALIKQGADVNARNNEGETPLMTTYSLDVMKLLVASGADVHAKDSGRKTALDHVMDREIDGQAEKYLRGLDQKSKR